uniref:Stamen-specific protein FIL1 n=1 Tax=Antirrhinum majus TaxID=4151 RepID=FIL1_ANTMA|nr:RecName: Full=Stamen-specific protein FIL1; Flags: Precursor [Antirrhinum majus]CAA40553.1 FIL1 [Antirrhinum majus]
MAAMKSIVPLVMLTVLVAQSQLITQSEAQTCSASLANLNACAPFVVLGAATTPSSDCCTALQSVDHECLCNTLRIASRVPAQCNLPPLSCGGKLSWTNC